MNKYLSGLSSAGGALPDDRLEFADAASPLGLQRPLSYLDWNKRWFSPSDFTSTSLTKNSANSVGFLVLSTIGVQKGVLSLVDVSEWGAGTLNFSLLWTGDSASTGVANLSLAVTELTTSPSDLSVGPPPTVTLADTAPSFPAELLNSSGSLSLTSQAVKINIRLVRSPGSTDDTYSDPVRVAGLLVEYTS